MSSDFNKRLDQVSRLDLVEMKKLIIFLREETNQSPTSQ